MPDKTPEAGPGHAERLGEQFDGTARLGCAAIGDGANPYFHYGTAIGQRLKPIDLIATAARRHPQRNADSVCRSSAMHP